MSYPFNNFVRISTFVVGRQAVITPVEPEPVLRVTMNGKIRTTMNGVPRSIKKV